MKYRKSPEDVYSILCSKASIFEIRPIIIELMREEAIIQAGNLDSGMIVQRHPLGFFACRWPLGGGRTLRLHLWDKQFAWAQESGWEIHDHIFSFLSLLLFGVLKNTVYEIDETLIKSRSLYSVYEVFYNGVESVMRPVRKGVVLKAVSNAEESTGSRYSMKAGVLHSSELLSSRALTVLTTFIDESASKVPHVVSSHEREIVAFDRSPSSKADSADLLLKFASYLENSI